jgi:hypothetical protein
LTLNNTLLIVDFLTPGVDLSLARKLPAVVGILLLLYGMITEQR